MAKLAPSILSADFSRLAEQVRLVEEAGADLLHVDVMDGHFVPNISFGADVMKSLVGHTNLPLDVHLMIEDPDRYLEDFVTPSTTYITVHQEACIHLDRTLAHIKECGVKAGVSINPGTPVGTLAEVLPQTDLVLIMSVNPGFGGQTFLPYTLPKVEELDRIREEKHLSFVTEIDGGVRLDNAGQIAAAGADILVAGSAVFGAEDLSKTVQAFLTEIR